MNYYHHESSGCMRMTLDPPHANERVIDANRYYANSSREFALMELDNKLREEKE